MEKQELYKTEEIDLSKRDDGGVGVKSWLTVSKTENGSYEFNTYRVFTGRPADDKAQEPYLTHTSTIDFESDEEAKEIAEIAFQQIKSICEPETDLFHFCRENAIRGTELSSLIQAEDYLKRGDETYKESFLAEFKARHGNHLGSTYAEIKAALFQDMVEHDECREAYNRLKARYDDSSQRLYKTLAEIPEEKLMKAMKVVGGFRDPANLEKVSQEFEERLKDDPWLAEKIREQETVEIKDGELVVFSMEGHILGVKKK